MKSIKNIARFAATLTGVAAIAVSCSDETVSRNDVSEHPIGFNVVLDHAKTTRVASITNETFSTFDVWAFKADANKADDETFVMGVSNSTGYQMSKTSTIGVLDPANGNWGYSNNSQVTFWPSDGTQQLSFYAISPSTVRTSLDNLSLNITKTAHAFNYKVEHDKQTDIIATGKTVNLTDINKTGTVGVVWMAVPLTFKHALSQVLFDANLVTNHPKLKVTIYDITICNAYQSGTCTINTDADGSFTWASTEDERKRDAYKVTTGTNEGITLYTEDGVNYSGTTGALSTYIPLSNGTTADNSDAILVIPQQLTAWNTEATNATIAAATGAYLKIHCAITQNDHNLLKEEYVYVPLSGKWKPNKIYTYHLTFGLGRDSQGKSNGMDITYTVSGGDWKSGTVPNPGL